MQKYIVSIVILVGSLVIATVIGEVALRIIAHQKHSIVTNLNPEEYGLLDTIPAQISPEMAKKVWAEGSNRTPNSEWTYIGQANRQFEFYIRGHWNNHSCHDSIDYAHDVKRPNILFLGDSFVEARQVTDDQTFYAILRREMGDRFNIMGCGRSGWGPWNAYVNISNIDDSVIKSSRLTGIDALKPEHLFYMIFLGNDLQNEASDAYITYLPKSEGCLKRKHAVSSPSYIINLLQLFYQMHFHTSRNDTHCADDEYWAYIDINHPAVAEGFRKMEESILKLKEYALRNGGQLSIGIIEPFPVPYGASRFAEALRYNFFDAAELKFDLEAPSRRLEQFLNNQGIPSINFTKGFQKTPKLEHYYTSDLHLSPDGHRIVAEEIAANFSRFFEIKSLSANEVRN